MDIKISDKEKICEIQEAFHNEYPFLKIEFFVLSHRTGEGSPRKNTVDKNKTLGDVRSDHSKGKINIQPQMTVAEMEEQFRSIYGLSVRVFRKSGKVWLQTTTTDDWTLMEQNQQGELLSKVF